MVSDVYCHVYIFIMPSFYIFNDPRYNDAYYIYAWLLISNFCYLQCMSMHSSGKRTDLTISFKRLGLKNFKPWSSYLMYT